MPGIRRLGSRLAQPALRGWFQSAFQERMPAAAAMLLIHSPSATVDLALITLK
jgi:secreted protein with Ig-like and vWFA domain